MLNAELRVISGKQAGSVIPLVSGRFLIGREEDCHLRPSNDLVSRHHCVFKTDEYTVRVRDLGSTNGTFVNGETLRGEVMLNTGDRVKVGTLEFEVAIAEGARTEDEAQIAEVASEVAAAVGAAESDTGTGTDQPDTSQTMAEMPTGTQGVPQDAALLDTGAFQGDTVYQPPQQPQYDPNQMPPGYGQPPPGYQMPYPQQYMYGQPYGMGPMGYPQQPMPYPPMYAPQQMPQHMPPQQTPPPPTADPAPQGEMNKGPGVSLPDPSTTGAKPPEPPAPDSGEAKAPSNEGAVSNTAMDIIKQYTQRRPGGKK